MSRIQRAVTSGAFILPMTLHIVSVTLLKIFLIHCAQKNFKIGVRPIIGCVRLLKLIFRFSGSTVASMSAILLFRRGRLRNLSRKRL